MSMQSIILDLACLAVVVLCAAYYARRGFVAGVFSFFGTLIALVLAGLAAYHLTPAIFDSFFRAGLEQSITDTIKEYGIHDINTLLAQVLSILPQHLVQTILQSLSPSLDFSAADIAYQVAKARPLCAKPPRPGPVGRA